MYRVRIEPSGHEFVALPQENLLEAALRSGINPRYSCSNGSCGDCRVRLLSGQVGQHMHGDFHFTEQEKSQGYLMLCTTRAESDLVIEGDEAHSTKDMPHQQIEVKVAKIEPRGEAVRILHLRTPRSNTFRFLAGQHASLKLKGLTPFDVTVASCPCNGMQLQFHLHRDAEHPLAMRVFDGLAHGKPLLLTGPFGDTTLDDDSVRPLLMLAIGTDFAAIKSLIEHAINLELGQPIRLFWLSDEVTGHYLDNYCRSWADVLDDYAYTLRTTTTAIPSKEELSALIPQMVSALSLPEADIYLAGPSQSVTYCREALMQAGADVQRLFEFRRRVALR